MDLRSDKHLFGTHFRPSSNTSILRFVERNSRTLIIQHLLMLSNAPLAYGRSRMSLNSVDHPAILRYHHASMIRILLLIVYEPSNRIVIRSIVVWLIQETATISICDADQVVGNWSMMKVVLLRVLDAVVVWVVLKTTIDSDVSTSNIDCIIRDSRVKDRVKILAFMLLSLKRIHIHWLWHSAIIMLADCVMRYQLLLSFDAVST